MSYLDVPSRGVRGYAQVTDAYLAALARAYGGALATLDAALASSQSGALLVPELER